VIACDVPDDEEPSDAPVLPPKLFARNLDTQRRIAAFGWLPVPWLG
jgi:hypothetical protein